MDLLKDHLKHLGFGLPLGGGKARLQDALTTVMDWELTASQQLRDEEARERAINSNIKSRLSQSNDIRCVIARVAEGSQRSFTPLPTTQPLTVMRFGASWTANLPNTPTAQDKPRLNQTQVNDILVKLGKLLVD